MPCTNPFLFFALSKLLLSSKLSQTYLWRGVTVLRRKPSSFSPWWSPITLKGDVWEFSLKERRDNHLIIYWFLLVNALLPHCKKSRGPVIPECSAYAILGRTCYPPFPPFLSLPSTQDWRSMISGTYAVGKQRHKQSITNPSRTSGINISVPLSPNNYGPPENIDEGL